VPNSLLPSPDLNGLKQLRSRDEAEQTNIENFGTELNRSYAVRWTWVATHSFLELRECEVDAPAELSSMRVDDIHP
jgi:hypothetical protein